MIVWELAPALRERERVGSNQKGEANSIRNTNKEDKDGGRGLLQSEEGNKGVEQKRCSYEKVLMLLMMMMNDDDEPKIVEDRL